MTIYPSNPFSVTVQAEAWSYPGIPYTDWTYDPFTIAFTRPASWDTPTTSATANKYYIAPDDPAATDSGNTYGHPDLPRKTLPNTSWIADPDTGTNVFPAGTVFFLSGTANGGNKWNSVQNNGHVGINLSFKGTESSPCWFVGDPNDLPEFGNSTFTFIDTQHLICNELSWNGDNAANGVLGLCRSDRDWPGAYITIKNCNFLNLDYKGGGGGVIACLAPTGAGYSAGTLKNVVFYNNLYKGCGGGFDWNASDGDHHGVKVGGGAAGETSRIWVIDCEAQPGDSADPIDGVFKALSGNIVQVGDANNPRALTHHVYCAGNKALTGGMRQGLLWTKSCTDVIFSSNRCDRTNQIFSADNGQTFGTQYDTEHHWFIFNESMNSAAGWMHTDSGGSRPGPFIVYGNLFKNIDSQGLNAVNSFDRSCVSLWNPYSNHYILNNTMQNCESGISSNNGTASYTHFIKNNIITVEQGNEQHGMWLGGNTIYEVENNIIDMVAFSCGIGGANYNSISAWNGLSGMSGNISADPLFTSPPTDLTLQAGSDGVNGGVMTTDVPALFVARYTGDPDYPGTPSIDVDFAGNTREVGTIDIGAYEKQ